MQERAFERYIPFSQRLDAFGMTFICFNVLRPSQQLFNHIVAISCLLRHNLYIKNKSFFHLSNIKFINVPPSADSRRHGRIQSPPPPENSQNIGSPSNIDPVL